MKQIDYCRHSGLSKARVSELAQQGMPLDTPESADAWRRQHVWSRKPPAPEGRPPEAAERPAAIDPAALDSTRVGQAFQRLEKAERICWALLAQALKNQAPDAARLLDLHSRSVRHLADNRQTVLDLAERERNLVSGDWVKGVMTSHDGAVASLLKAMPRQLSGRISPHDPEHCERELNRWVQEVALATLHSTDPWKK
jgi:phage terminase Nu1 subunit (DNA packaging protein)